MARHPLSPPVRRGGRFVLLAAAGALVLGLVVPNVQAAEPLATPVDPFTATGLPDFDSRVGTVVPTELQLAAAEDLGATVRWNRFGTPQSVMSLDGRLGTGGPGNPVEDARQWLRDNSTLFGFADTTWVDRLELLNDGRLATGAGHAVLFRQVFGTLQSGVDGLVTVGIEGDAIVYLSSSIAKTAQSPPAAVLAVADAWRKASANVGRPVSPGAIHEITEQPKTGWTVFAVDGFAQVQRGRLRALPLRNGAVRPVYEVNVVDVQAGQTTAYTSFVDAVSGQVRVRHNQVDSLTDAEPQSEYTAPFQGAITATECGPRHPFEVDALTKTIIVAAGEVQTANDIVLNLYGPADTLVASGDTGTSPETVTYSPAGGVPAGEYEAEVCPFDEPTAPFVPPGDYVGVFIASEQEPPDVELAYPPMWDSFVANPALDFDSGVTIDNRLTGCWVAEVDGDPVEGCDNPPSPLNNLAARAPWDLDIRTQFPTFTTDGNAASTAEAWLSPLTPGGFFQRPFEVDRTYQPAFEDRWNNSRCNPAELILGGNDVLASVTSLFSSHNRMHDFSYFLGFTEDNSNLQKNNFGLTGPARGQDPEIGNAQAGAITGGAPSYLGRDNANQITLQDGIPGITNQYLFQPIAGAFYAPCVDGDFDMSIVGHEYTHAISNRMVAGPDAGLSGFQAGSMGESWGDLVGLEYQFEHDYDMGTSPWVVGPYATGNLDTGIRNYALDSNPLQYGDIGFDVTGPEVHADGEVWSAAMFDVRQALVRKYDARFPESDVDLQRDCAQGNTAAEPPAAPLRPTECPGNRRWIQLMFDSFLLQPSATSMLDARDAFLAADQMRFGGRNQKAIWTAFARNGMGEQASTVGTEDDQPIPDYTSPLADEGTFVFSARAMDVVDQPLLENARLYLGRYEARVTPVADADPATELDDVVDLVPGKYTFVMQADGYGLRRFKRTIVANETIDRAIHPVTNVASASAGASVDGASVGSLNTSKLIDDTEASNWAGINPAGVSVDTLNPFVNVDLAGDSPRAVRSVNVSAMLRPASPDQEEDPEQPDDASGSRFTALRQFAIETCTESLTSDCSSLLPGDSPGSPYTRIYTSDADAFDATAPRPVAPDLLFERFDVPDTMATHVRLVALENQCSGTAEYAGEQDDDPLNATDCKTASAADEGVRAAELEVFEFDKSTVPPGDPVVVMGMTGAAVAAPLTNVAYEFTYVNLGPKPSVDALIEYVLPTGVTFVSATDGGIYDVPSRTVRWDLGTVAVDVTGDVGVTVKMPPVPGVVLNVGQFSGKLTHSPPAATVTVVQ